MPRLSVLITTKNRVVLLRRALESVIAQTKIAELVIIDDGSTDGTSEFVSRHYPDAVLVRNETSVGIIAARNQGILMSSGEFVLTLDDDAVLRHPTTLERVETLFGDARVGVVALPVVDVLDGVEQDIRWPEVDDDAVMCSASFGAGAAAVRRTVFEQLGGYAGIDRQGEESDFSLRMLDRGWVVRPAPRDIHIRHFPGHKMTLQAYILGSAARNRLLSVWARSPWFVVPFESLAVVANYARLGLVTGHLGSVVRGLAGGMRTSWAMRQSRRPVSSSAYRLHRRLVRDGPLSLAAIEDTLSDLEGRFKN